MSTIDIVFDGPPGPEAGRFVEVEDDSGKSISVGEWIHRPDGFWALRMPDPRPDVSSIEKSWTTEQSSNLSSAVYYPRESILEIEFRSSSRYQYFEVSQHVAEELFSSEQPGMNLAKKIKGIYRYAKKE
jgi:hypothetical protein